MRYIILPIGDGLVVAAVVGPLVGVFAVAAVVGQVSLLQV